jgi:uncharacterized protein (TIGR02453 family)
MTDFAGFGPKTKKFLRELGRNNDKAWFDAHRSDYEAHYLEPAKAFIEAAGPKLEKIAPNVVWEPRVNGSIFRVNRDIRFSKDKTPYKDHIDLWFWEGQRKTAISGFFLRITSTSVHLGAGSHGFSKEALASYRSALLDEKAAKSLAALTKRLARAGYEVGGKTYKKPPRGFDGNAAVQDLVLYSALWAAADRKSPPELGSAKFVSYCVREWKKLAPIHRWLMENVRGA